MKILHIDPDDIDNPMSGGGPIRTYEIYRRLARRHEITVLTPTFSGSTPEVIRDGIRYVRIGRRVGNHGGSHHITFLLGLPKALKRFDYDLLVEDFMPPMSVTFNPFWNKKPMIASVQWFHAKVVSRQLKFPFFLGERYGLRWYDNFVVLTESMKKRMTDRRPNARCEVIPNAVDACLFESSPNFGDYILYIGGIDFPLKGVDLLLCAYAMIPEEERSPLILAGHGCEWGRFHELIRSLELAPWVKAIGKVGKAERNKLLSDCRFVCVPSRRETFGMVILESCASAKPVVLFDYPPMNEVASRGGCLFAEPFSVESYSKKMRQMLHYTREQIFSLGEQCRQWGRQYDWDDIADHQELFYERVVSGSK